MFNADAPTRDELSTSAQLIRSTIIAIVSAIVILVTVVLPAEYAIDPTGVGRVLGLAEMGEIKQQLADEAARDEARTDPESGLVGRLLAMLLVGPASAQPPATARSNEMTITLKPGDGSEIKLTMRKGAKAGFAWTVAGGVVNFDLHGDSASEETSYQKGRASKGADGILEAAFDGNHGWFWRNRGSAPVTVTLRTSGDYTAIKKVL